MKSNKSKSKPNNMMQLLRKLSKNWLRPKKPSLQLAKNKLRTPKPSLLRKEDMTIKPKNLQESPEEKWDNNAQLNSQLYSLTSLRPEASETLACAHAKEMLVEAIR